MDNPLERGSAVTKLKHNAMIVLIYQPNLNLTLYWLGITFRKMGVYIGINNITRRL